MGAGASALPPPEEKKGAKAKAPSKGAKKAKEPSAADVLKKAAASEAAGKALFEALDTAKDGRLSADELKEAVKKEAEKTQATWTDELITDVLAFFGDGEGMLDWAAFSKALAELSAHGGAFDAADIHSRAAARTASLGVWKKHGKDDGTWDKAASGKLIREINSETYWDDFGAKVTAWHAELTGSEEKKAVATLDQFLAAYPALLAEVEAIKERKSVFDVQLTPEQRHA